MILAIDIGNTATHFGFFERGRLARQWVIPTRPGQAPAALARRLKRFHRRIRAEEILICSVVPRMSRTLVRALRRLGAGPIRVVGRDVRVPLRNRYRRPEQVGQDRLVGAYAAWRIYRSNCIVVDFGTAITIDVVRNGSYEGGVIVPGLQISLDALAARTALLPQVSLRRPPELLGRDTANSIRSGLLYGYGALCDGLVAQLKRRYAPRATVVATGGGSPLMARYAKTLDHVRPQLVLEGLYYLSAAGR